MLFLPRRVSVLCASLLFLAACGGGGGSESSGESVPSQTTSSSSGGSVSTPDTQAPSSPEALGFSADRDERLAQVGWGVMTGGGGLRHLSGWALSGQWSVNTPVFLDRR
ncbi:MAG: hypothetical protein IPL70_14375 [Uliginosibacterium sp.]|nr:hypothetical protein [Uliginosibacterium sp.]